MTVRLRRSVPILRIFDEDKTREFYRDFLGFTIEFEHRFHEGAPLFMGISRDGLLIMLSEHHGDGTPGSRVRVDVEGIHELLEELQAKRYKYYKPSIETKEWGLYELCVTDPFGNMLIFAEPIR